MKIIGSFFLSIIAFAISVYCALGSVMTAWVSATPTNRDISELQFIFFLWLIGAVVGFVIGVFMARKTWENYKERNQLGIKGMLPFDDKKE